MLRLETAKVAARCPLMHGKRGPRPGLGRAPVDHQHGHLHGVGTEPAKASSGAAPTRLSTIVNGSCSLT